MNKKLKIAVVAVSLAVIAFAITGGLTVHATNNDDGAYRQLGVYSEVLQRIRSEYVEEPNYDAVKNGALKGLLESLDANSSYLSPAEYKEYKEHRQDYKAGIGATVSKRFGFAAVVATIPGGPADKAGLSTGDILESIEGKNTRDISLAEIRYLLEGQKGSQVTMSVIHPRKAEPQKLVFQRDEVAQPAAQEKIIESGIGYIRPGSFVKGKTQEIAAKIKQAQNSGAKKLILDLRNTAEGEMSEGIASANLFLDHGTITTLKGQHYKTENYVADPSKAVTKLPMVVLVNRGTAGPAEVLAAAVFENQRADLVGDKTFGVGSVTNLIEVQDGSAVILSVAKYFSPTGKAIQDLAVTPNIQVADAATANDEASSDDGEDDNGQAEPQKKEEKPKVDELLNRAIAVLKAKNS
jgi:carboxyl-terminal processing protease